MSKPQTATTPQASADGNPRAAKEHKLKALEEQGIEAFPHSYTRTHKAGDLQAKYADLSNGVETEDQVNIAGRILAMRNSGMFIDLHDPSGHVQVFCHAESLPEDGMNMLKFLDLGDIIGVSGTIRRTPRGELSVRAKEVKVLTKSIEPLPDKYHGINDIELIYRRPEVNMIVSQEDRETLRTRSKVISLIRRYMEDMVGAVEVETPILQPIMGGATARPFVTHHNALDADFFLRVATELHLKRLVVGGFADDVFEIGRIFRNEGISYKHNPEFTSIEGYHAYKDYHDIMELVEDLVRHLVMQIHGKLQVPCGERELDFTGPWPRRSMCELVQEATGINTFDYDAKGLIKAAEAIGVKLDPKLNWGQAVEGLFSEKVEPNLFQPIHVTDFPVEISPLAKSHRNDPRLVERFETYVNMCEIANAFTELNDPRVQLQRFMAQVEQRENGDDEAQMLDEDFVAALEIGLPPTGGWGMGIDRLVMMLTDSTNIRQVIAFPTLKPRPTE